MKCSLTNQVCDALLLFSVGGAPPHALLNNFYLKATWRQRVIQIENEPDRQIRRKQASLYNSNLEFTNIGQWLCPALHSALHYASDGIPCVNNICIPDTAQQGCNRVAEYALAQWKLSMCSCVFPSSGGQEHRKTAARQTGNIWIPSYKWLSCLWHVKLLSAPATVNQHLPIPSDPPRRHQSNNPATFL